MRLPCLFLATFLAAAVHAAEADAEPPGPRTTTPKIPSKTAPPRPITAEGDYSEHALRNGVTATRAQCDRIAHALWSETPHGETGCITYWSGGLAPGRPVKRAVVYFPGDAFDTGTRATPAYLATTHDALADSAGRWSERLALPYVFVARPGTFGASGDHTERRRPAESRIVSAALDALKRRHGIEEFVVAGYSGGGHVVASLVTLRNDITCAVAGAAPSSPRLRARLRHWRVDATGHADSYEPTEHLRRDAVHPRLRILVVGDPRDSNGVWPAQVILADAARAQGLSAEVIEVTGTGPTFHGGQGDLIREIAGWCANDVDAAEIARRASTR